MLQLMDKKMFTILRSIILFIQAFRYECAIQNYFSYFSTKTYVVSTQKNCLNETLKRPISLRRFFWVPINICSNSRKYTQLYAKKFAYM